MLRNRRLPNLLALRAFEAAARRQSFTLAGEELHVSHVAVSRQVRMLETRLGVALFERKGRGVALTPAGRRYCEILTDIFDRIDVATKEMSRPARAARLLLRVDPGFATCWLSRRIGEFSAREPEVEVEILSTLAHPAPHDGDFDAAICFLPSGRELVGGLEVEHLIDLTAFPVCSPDLLPAADGCSPVDSIRSQRLLHEQSTDLWRNWLSAANAPDIDWSRGPIFHDTYLAINAAMTGEGIAIGDNFLIVEELESGRLVKPFDTGIPCGSYYLYWSKSNARNKGLQCFRRWITEACASERTRSSRWG